MRRRNFITLLGGAAVAWPVMARAQQPTKVARIGVLITGSLTETRINIDPFRRGLTELGYREGQNFILEHGERTARSSTYRAWQKNSLL